MKVKERGTIADLKEAYETWQLKAVYDSHLDPIATKDIIGSSTETWDLRIRW